MDECKPLASGRGRCRSFRHMPPSRQERRKAERDAAKRAPARTGAAAAAGAGAALANLNMNPLGDWTTQAGAYTRSRFSST